MEERQHNGQKKTDKRTNYDLSTVFYFTFVKAVNDNWVFVFKYMYVIFNFYNPMPVFISCMVNRKRIYNSYSICKHSLIYGCTSSNMKLCL